MMKRFFFKSALLAVLFASAFISCSDDDEAPLSVLPLASETTTPIFDKSGVFILNEGKFGENNSKLTYYNRNKNEVTENIFEVQNKEKGLKLGAGAQDIIVYGGKMYITVTESNMIYVTDRQGKVLKSISTSATDYRQPRYLAAHGGFVYADFYSGHIAKIDTTKMDVVNQLSIDAYPEEMTVVGNELYVTNSQYYGAEVAGNTVTVINLSSFSKTSTIDVVDNPNQIAKDKNDNIYVLSMGNYGDIKNTLSVIKKGTNKATIIEEEVGTCMAAASNELLLAYRGFDNKTAYSSYDVVLNKYVAEAFITIPEEETDRLDLAYAIAVNPTNADIYVTTTDYTNTGYVYLFDKNGKGKVKFNSKGVNPRKVVFLAQ